MEDQTANRTAEPGSADTLAEASGPAGLMTDRPPPTDLPVGASAPADLPASATPPADPLPDASTPADPPPDATTPADPPPDATSPADPPPDATTRADPLADAGGPALRRDGLLARIAPFAVLACLAEASLALPPGPASIPDAIASLVILAVTAALVVLLPWDRLPAWYDVAVPLLYTASVFPLVQAAGGEYAGIMLILLSPIIWSALFHRPWESACVSAAALAVVLATSLRDGAGSPAVLIRRMISWAALAAMIAVAGHGLRARVRRSRQQAALMQERLREMSILADRDRIASSLHDTVVQRLFASGLSLQGTVGLLDGQSDVARRIDQVVQDLDESITLLRQSIFDPARGAPARGLRRSILDVSSELTPWLGVVPEVTLEGPLDTEVPARAAGQLLGVLREGLARSGAWANATQVAVAVAADHEAVTLTITDDGTQWATRAAGDGPTLPVLRARAHQVGGTVATESAATGETRLIWRAPLRTIPRGAPSG
ncbi:MAG TPA: histidine kinase [Streptosporangiaceae bacterium]